VICTSSMRLEQRHRYLLNPGSVDPPGGGEEGIKRQIGMWRFRHIPNSCALLPVAEPAARSIREVDRNRNNDLSRLLFQHGQALAQSVQAQAGVP
jgi:hypothetical protein